MKLVNWLQDSWLLMMRTKPQYISVLGRKRSSIRSPPKLSPREGKYAKAYGVFMCIVTMCCSISYGVLLVLSEGIAPSSLTAYVVSLAVAGIVAISGGLCLAEYISNQPQETPSIYSCCYQYSSEILAFLFGWTWIVSQIAVISAICKILTVHVNDWSDDIPRKFLERIFYDYAKDVPSLIFVLLLILFILTGFGETLVWFAFFVPVAFGLIAALYVIGCIMDDSERSSVDTLKLDDIKGVDEVLSISTLCILFFSGPQSLVRLPITYIRKNTAAVLGPLNGIILVISFIFIMAASFLGKFVVSSTPDDLLNLLSNILCTISLCSIGIETFYGLHYTIEDMSSDGLLFRSFSKKWKPFCFPVLSPMVHVLTFAAVGLLSVFIPLLDVLNLAVVFPLLVNSTVPYLVLLQRYSDNSSWQYEPMFHTAARSVLQDRSRKKSQEFQYSHAPEFEIKDDRTIEVSTTCIEENFSDSSTSDTDIDAVVQQYKEQTRVANTANLDDPIRSSLTPEPTSSSSFRAKLCVALLITTSLIISLTLNFAYPKDHFSVLIIVLLCVLFSTVVQGLLICLPQNKKLDGSNGCCPRIPSMPWIPGMGSLLSCSLLTQALIKTWKISFGCLIVGALLYFLYGIRSSTAANSFYNMRATHITLRPLPSYGNTCIPQVIPSQRKMAKSRKIKKLNTGSL